jgi:sec-independent protein translocase protein TatA
MLALFGPLGLPEMVIILFIVILIFGANRLPDIGRGIGRGIRNFKDATKEAANKNDV